VLKARRCQRIVSFTKNIYLGLSDGSCIKSCILSDNVTYLMMGRLGGKAEKTNRRNQDVRVERCEQWNIKLEVGKCC
jgi:hypothetical protein